MYNRYEKQLNSAPKESKSAKRSGSSSNVGTMNNLVQDVLERQLRGANERLAAMTQQKQESDTKWAALLEESNKKCAELTQQNETLKLNQARLDATMSMHSKTVEELNSKLEVRNRKLEKARADLQQLNTQVSANSSELPNLRSQVDTAKKQLEARTAQLERANADLKVVTAAKTEVELAKRDLEKRLQNLQATLNDEIREVGRLKDRERNSFSELERLQRQLAQKDAELVAERKRSEEQLRTAFANQKVQVVEKPTLVVASPAPPMLTATPVPKVSVCTQTKSQHVDSTDAGVNGDRAASDAELRKKYEIALLEIRRLQRELRKCDERFNEVQSSVTRLKLNHRRILERALFEDSRCANAHCCTYSEVHCRGRGVNQSRPNSLASRRQAAATHCAAVGVLFFSTVRNAKATKS